MDGKETDDGHRKKASGLRLQKGGEYSFKRKVPISREVCRIAALSKKMDLEQRGDWYHWRLGIQKEEESAPKKGEGRSLRSVGVSAHVVQ